MDGGTPKTDMQCKNRIDTVKKKFKLEKCKMVSRWCFFHKLEHFIGPAAKTSTPLAALPPPKLLKNHKREQDSLSSETEPQDSPESTDTYPPKPAKKRRTNNPNSTATRDPKRKRNPNGDVRVMKQGMSSVGELTKAVLNLGEVYEQAENANLRQLMEMEKHRMKFTKDLELQRMQLFMKTQLEISQIKEAASNSYGNNRSNHLHRQLDRNGSNKHC